MFDFKKITGNLFDFATPDFLRDWINKLIDKVETVEHEKKLLEEKNERLEAEIRRLKGLPAKPVFASSDQTSDLDKEDKPATSDPDKKKPNPGRGKPRRKKKDIKIDVTKRLSINTSDLDGTYEYKGTRKVVVQDILFQRNNIAFELEKFYSSHYGKTLEADLPEGFDGGYFGPNLKAFILCSYYEGDVTIKKIHRVLKAIGIEISLKQINRIINHRPDKLKQEMDEARMAGIEKHKFQQIDDTHARILEAHGFATTIVVCNPSFTNLVTTDSKSRAEAVLALAGGNKSPFYKINQQAVIVVLGSKRSMNCQYILEKWKSEKVYSESELEELFTHEDFRSFSPLILYDIRNAMLVGAFYDGHLGVTGDALMSDDAGQFDNIFDDHGLCWPHELRHYKKFTPTSLHHQNLLNAFFSEAKSLYKTLKDWIQTRRPEVRDLIFNWFNTFFTIESGYKLLDDRKKLTHGKIDKLLAPLWTEVKIPLHNNESERDLRGRVVKRKISLFDQTWNGAWARDLYISLKQTCTKNGVSFYLFLLDRIRGERCLPQLGEIIKGSCPQH